MGFMSMMITLFLGLLVSVPAILLAKEINFDKMLVANIVVTGNKTIGETDDNYVCATIDWFPSDTCRYNYCMLQNSSAITLDLSNPLLAKTIQAFKNLRLRIGGSPQDQVIYNVGSPRYPCRPFQKAANGLFGLTSGCLYMERWDELNHFFNKTGAIVTFGLNALYGRKKQNKSTLWVGDWDPSNARALMNYTILKGYHIDSWEFGNELSGSGIAARVEAAQYAKDVINLKKIMKELYKTTNYNSRLVAPGGFFNKGWYTELLQDSGPSIVDVVTHHIYNLGGGNDPNLIRKILDPAYLTKSVLDTFTNIEGVIQDYAPWANIWVGESGGAFQGGGRYVSDRFVNSFWYLDQLGMAAKYSTKVYCRQTLVGANYALLNRTTMEPNPDYYSALLWHRLMGKGVFDVHRRYAAPYLRPYAHCSKGRAGITLLLINLSNQTEFIVNVNNRTKFKFQEREKRRERPSHGRSFREEYHLSAQHGNLRSQTSLLNGHPLHVTNGELPKLDPLLREENSPIRVAPLSIAFIVIPNFEASACAQPAPSSC
ncbi:heparanase-like protein 1 [Corylus avellana]|uniref:heparanase-like protein 1 n=1 Tax=Corylus avellana TaxID=13451 RepID=UPI00286AFD2A|nr:heparanase-like protein 1 [Corylus avellana]